MEEGGTFYKRSCLYINSGSPAALSGRIKQLASSNFNRKEQYEGIILPRDLVNLGKKKTSQPLDKKKIRLSYLIIGSWDDLDPIELEP
jgi:hypothetical protein